MINKQRELLQNRLNRGVRPETAIDAEVAAAKWAQAAACNGEIVAYFAPLHGPAAVLDLNWENWK